jgi:fumarate reductase flavoprotein subunit
MSETSNNADVIIVGGGIAGLVTANRAAQAGFKPLVLEKGAEDKYLCNSRYTGGVFHIAYRDVMRSEDELYERIEEETEGRASPALAKLVARDAKRAVRWLQSEGMHFIKGGPMEWQNWVLAPPALGRPGLHYEGRGGDVLLRQLEKNLIGRGGMLQRGVRAKRIVTDQSGRCCGVEATLNGAVQRFIGKAVVLCDGGYQGNLDFLRKYNSRYPERLKQRGAATAIGDGLTMAQERGAKLVGLDYFYGHLLSREALHNPNLWPLPWMDYVSCAGIVIDGNAKRFADEGRGGVSVANAIARLDDPLSAVAVFDQAIWDGPATEMIVPANPNLVNAGGTLISANSLLDLAAQLKLDAARLKATVDAYNQALASNQASALDPTRTTRERKAYPVTKPPFHAIPLCAGITYTMGGIAIDDCSRALDENNQPIAGLYAAGTTTGGLEGGPSGGYVGGLVKSSVTALRAAEHLTGSA